MIGNVTVDPRNLLDIEGAYATLAEISVALEEKRPLAPGDWLDYSARLAGFMGGITQAMFAFQKACAKEEADRVEGGATSTAAKQHVRALDEHWEAKKLEALYKQVEHMVHVAKKQATVARGTWNG